MTKSKGAPPGNENRLIHGGERAIKALTDGRPLAGPAAEQEQLVRAELETEGRYAIVKRAACRLEAVSRLFWGCIVDAAEAGDLQAVDKFTKRYGWLQQASLRAWAQVRDEEKNTNKGTLEVLLSQEVDDGKDVSN